MLSALIDSREPPEIQELDFGVPTVATVLEAGDVMVTCDDGNTIVIERKTPSDLLNSIRDGRLFDQCARMKELSEFCYLAIIGRMDMVQDNKVRVDGYRITGWSWGSLQGALLTVQELGVGVIHADDFKSAVERLARRDRGNVAIRPRRQSEPMELDEAFLVSLPGIGPVLAKKILAHGCAAWALDWLTDVWSDGPKVPGVGYSQKMKIRDVLGLQSKGREYLTVNLWEGERDEWEDK